MTEASAPTAEQFAWHRPDQAVTGRTHTVRAKVKTAWASLYADVCFDHTGAPIRIAISQPGKFSDTEMGIFMDRMNDAVNAALAAGEGHASVDPIHVTAPRNRDGSVQRVAIHWPSRMGDEPLQNMIDALSKAITETIREARQA